MIFKMMSWHIGNEFYNIYFCFDLTLVPQITGTGTFYHKETVVYNIITMITSYI